ncbi:hypothetical protein [Cryptosporangium sp. NPDC048952]|uniref:hypothetical protein n=1 Tax=Cryptosporangium sp. NPDC048952 TaxID=3363961 RepID=UPI003722D9AE
MSTELRSDPESRGDDLLGRAGRWVFAKVWFGCLLSGLYAFSSHIGWPQAVVILFAVLGAVCLAVTSLWLPYWTRGHLTGVVVVVDVAVRIVVWAGLVVTVVCLLVGDPAVGAVAGALLVNTAWRTFGEKPEIRRPGWRRAP